MPNAFDKDMAEYAKRRIKENGIRVLTSMSLKGINGEDHVESVNTDSGVLAADIVILAIGVRPATAFLKDSGIEMFKGTVIVDANMQTNICAYSRIVTASSGVRTSNTPESPTPSTGGTKGSAPVAMTNLSYTIR